MTAIGIPLPQPLQDENGIMDIVGVDPQSAIFVRFLLLGNEHLFISDSRYPVGWASEWQLATIRLQA